MAIWFTFSTLLTVYNKVVFGKGKKHFPCPLLMTSVHFLMQWVFSWLISSIFPQKFGGDIVKAMSWRKFLSVSVPCGVVFATDIGLSNLSIVSVTLTFYTLVKSSTPIFVLFFAFGLKLEKPSWALFGIVMTIAAGEVLTVVGETQFDLSGFLLVLSASACAGLKWTMIQLLLSRLDPPLPSSFASLRVLGPMMFLSMLVLSAIIERPWEKLSPKDTYYFSTLENSVHTFLLAAFGGSLAIAMVLAEFSLIMQSSAMVLMIAGVVKELITVVVGVTVFKDELGIINEFGIVVIFSGVILYKVVFHLKKKKDHERLQSEDDDIWRQDISPSGYNEKLGDDVDVPFGMIENFAIDDDDDNLYSSMAEERPQDNSSSAARKKSGKVFTEVKSEDDLEINGHTIT